MNFTWVTMLNLYEKYPVVAMPSNFLEEAGGFACGFPVPAHIQLTPNHWLLATHSLPSIFRTTGRTQGSRAKAGQAAKKARKKKVA